MEMEMEMEMERDKNKNKSSVVSMLVQWFEPILYKYLLGLFKSRVLNVIFDAFAWKFLHEPVCSFKDEQIYAEK